MATPFPIPQLSGLKTILAYQPAWLRSDLLAGITVAAYLIPQCMAYGELAGVSPVAGLWAILPPLLIYTFIGSSRQLSVGPESGTALLTAATIAPLATGEHYAGLAALLAMIVGIICLIGYLTKLGFLANLLSKPILVGYMTGVSIIMMLGQLSNITHIALTANTPWAQVPELIGKLAQIHPPTFLLALFVLTFLYVVQWLMPKAPAALLAILLATSAVVIFHLDQSGVVVVGQIPAGFPSLALPPLSIANIQSLSGAALGIALVGYSDNVLTARAFASRNGYTIDANQELFALGCCNLANGLMQGFPISSSGSRTAIGETLGSRTQLFSVVALVVVILVLLFLRPVLALFPKAALGAIVIYAASRLIEVPAFIRLYRFRSSEFRLALVTTLGVLFTDIIVGVVLAIILSMLDLFARVANPTDAVFGRTPEMNSMDSLVRPGLLIYRYDAPLCFANAENFKRRAVAAIESSPQPVQWFIVNAEAIGSVDITAIEMLMALHSELSTQGIIFGLVHVKSAIVAELEHSGFLDQIGSCYRFPTLRAVAETYAEQQKNNETCRVT